MHGSLFINFIAIFALMLACSADFSGSGDKFSGGPAKKLDNESDCTSGFSNNPNCSNSNDLFGGETSGIDGLAGETIAGDTNTIPAGGQTKTADQIKQEEFNATLRKTLPGYEVKSVMIKMEDGHDQSFGDLQTCVRGAFKIDNTGLTIYSVKKQTVNIHPRDYGCEKATTLVITGSNGVVKENRYVARGTSASINFEAGDSLVIKGHITRVTDGAKCREPFNSNMPGSSRFQPGC